MTNAYTRMKAARAELDSVWDHPSAVSVIHYSCESFYNRPNGSSPRITSIAIRNLKTAQTVSFSIHKEGELHGLAAANLNEHYGELERKMLDRFYEAVKERKEHVWLHWNMRDENFGFHAIELRYRILEGEPATIADDRKYDLARVLIGIYGKRYVPHGESGRLHTLTGMNGVKSRNSKTGAEEAALFDAGDYVALHQSTLSKVDEISTIAQLAYEEELRTTAKFMETHGVSLLAFIDWLASNPVILLASLCGNLVWILGAVRGLLKTFGTP